MNAKKAIKPMISVIMGVYNCENTVAKAIESILEQTYQDFEFVICDDGSKDGTPDIIQKYYLQYPEKIIFLKNEFNRGLNYTLNRCLECSKGKYIARMDGDDISMPSRFEIELSYLEEHPEIAILSTAMNIFDENGVWATRKYKSHPTKKDFLKGTPFSHPACMVKREAYEAVGGYSEEEKLLRVEDYHLWLKMYCKGFQGANIDDIVYLYRDDRNGYAKRKFKYRINESHVIVQVVKLMKLPVYDYIYALRPIIVGLFPYRIYDYLHKMRMKKGDH